MLVARHDVRNILVFLEQIFQVGDILRTKLVLALIAFNRAVHEYKYLLLIRVGVQIRLQEFSLGFADKAWRLLILGLFGAVTLRWRRSLVIVGIQRDKS